MLTHPQIVKSRNMPRGFKAGGRKKGTKNKPLSRKIGKALGVQAFETLAQLDRKKGQMSMADIMVDGARYVAGLASKARAEAATDPSKEKIAAELSQAATKMAREVSPYLYPTLQSIKHGGDEDAPPIRIENLSDHQLEKLIERLRRG